MLKKINLRYLLLVTAAGVLYLIIVQRPYIERQQCADKAARYYGGYSSAAASPELYKDYQRYYTVCVNKAGLPF